MLPQEPQLRGNQIWYVLDGFRHGLEPDLMRVFRGDSKKDTFTKTRIHVGIDTNSIEDRRAMSWISKSRKSSIEYMFTVSEGELEDIPEKPYKHYSGLTNKVDYLGPVAFDRLTSPDVWHTTIGNKKKLYGDVPLGARLDFFFF